MWVRRSRPVAPSQQLYEGIRGAILSGELAPGSRLPATRALASREGIARNTALRVYARLTADGYAVGRHGRGTFVAPALAGKPEARRAPLVRRTPSARRVSRPPGARPWLSRRGQRIEQMDPSWTGDGRRLAFDFRYGRPSLEDFPMAVWRRLLARSMREATTDDLDYGDPAGVTRLRQAIARHVRDTRAVACTAEQVIVTSGSQQALSLVADLLLDPGDRVLMEEPGYAGAARAFAATGAELVPAPVGGEGLDTAILSDRRSRSARLVYVTPSHQFPTGVVMPLAARLALLDWAAKSGAWVFEDDYDSEFRYGTPPVESLQGLDGHGCVLYAGTLSKVLFPALRLGYLVVPEALVAVLRKAKAIADTGTSTAEQRALAHFVEGGHFDRHLKRSRLRNAARREALLEALEKRLGSRAEVLGTNAGLHVMLRLLGLPVRRERALISAARRAGVGVYSPARFFLQPEGRTEAALMLGYTSLAPEQIRRGVSRFARVLESFC